MTAATINKINAAYASGGPELTLETLQNLTGLRLKHYIVVNFGGLPSPSYMTCCIDRAAESREGARPCTPGPTESVMVRRQHAGSTRGC